MYRCYLLRDGRIVRGETLDVATLEKAVADGRRRLAMRSRLGPFSGIEIWCGTRLLYSDTAYGDATAAPIDSPFDTPDTTMLPNWRPSLGRPITAAPSAGGQDGGATEAETARPAPPRKAVRRRPARGRIAA